MLEHLKERIAESEKDDCRVCFDEMTEMVATGCCKNVFCKNCLSTILNTTNKCPFCREKINVGLLTMSSNLDQSNNSSSEIIQTKEQALRSIINSKKDGRFLIYSEYGESYVSLENFLKENNILFHTVKGNTDVKQKMIREYKEGKVQFLLLNATYDCSGINLQETTDIILFHKLSRKEYEVQVIGRALRLGRTSDLYVHQLLNEEEKNLEYTN